MSVPANWHAHPSTVKMDFGLPEEAPVQPTKDSLESHDVSENSASDQLSRELGDQDATVHDDEATLEMARRPELNEEPVPDLQDAPNSPESDVFDKLSKTLAEQATMLEQDDAKLEKRLRLKVVKALKNYSLDHATVGELLSEYKKVYKSQRQWTAIATEIGAAINCSARTIYRMVDEHNQSLNPAPAPEAKFDRTAIDGPELDKQERRTRDARLAIRIFLNDIQPEKKLEMLAILLSEEAHQIWGKTDPFEIRVNPRPSNLTIDGRKRMQEPQTEEVAA